MFATAEDCIKNTNQTHGETNGAHLCVQLLHALGIKECFGVSGGGVAFLWEALEQHESIKFIHTKHENGAGFSAIESSLLSNRPSCVMVTTGPGLSNVLTSMLAAKWEGAKVILLSGHSSTENVGRWSGQETSSTSFGGHDFFHSHRFFDYAKVIDNSTDLSIAFHQLAEQLHHKKSFVAHLSLTLSFQKKRIAVQHPVHRTIQLSVQEGNTKYFNNIAEEITNKKTILWLGHGARGASSYIRKFLNNIQLPVISTPRGKGIVDELSDYYVGVSGVGGHDSIKQVFEEFSPEIVIVVGTRLGQSSSNWLKECTPSDKIIHVDVDESAFSLAFPDVPIDTVKMSSEDFFSSLLESSKNIKLRWCYNLQLNPYLHKLNHRSYQLPDLSSPIRTQHVFHIIQKCIVDKTDSPLIVEAGNSYAWGSHVLCWSTPNRYRVSSGWASMGQAASGILGMALASKNRAYAVVGDGSMLMGNEIHTAVQHQLSCTWIVINDSAYGMCYQGVRILQLSGIKDELASVNFANYATSMGASSKRVATIVDFIEAVESSKKSIGPFVIDVVISDKTEPAPIGNRIVALKQSV